MESPLKLKPAPKRRRISFNQEKCAVCHENKPQGLRESKPGRERFLCALKIRHEAGHCIQYDRLKDILSVNDAGDLLLEDNVVLKWHKDCYSSFTSKTNLEIV